jgi:quinol monooxygenase YgiN
MRAFSTYKQWKLKDGKEEADLIALVRNEIAPHYRKLDGCVGLGLLRIAGSRSYLAIQHWTSREAREATLASEFYTSWLAAYRPTLERWDRIMEFEDEWEAEDILGLV